MIMEMSKLWLKKRLKSVKYLSIDHCLKHTNKHLSVQFEFTQVENDLYIIFVLFDMGESIIFLSNIFMTC